MSVPAVLIRTSNGEIIKHDVYPREDMALVEGLDPDLKWLVKFTPFVKPDYDSRIFILRQVEEVTTIAHPDYEHLNQYKITFETEKRQDADIETSIANAEQDANQQMLPATRQLKLMALGLGVLFRALDGLELSSKEKVIKDEIVTKATKLWKNDNNLRNKITQLAQGEEPEIDAGWEKE